MIGDSKENGGTFQIKRWGDVSSLAILLSMMLAGVTWGLKLDNRTDVLRTDMSGDEQRLSKIETLLASGQMAMVQTRVVELQREIDRLETELQSLRARDTELTERMSTNERRR